MKNQRIKEWDFTIERGGVLERTVVDMDGQVHHPSPNGHGKDQHFSANEERTYRQIIDAAIIANGGLRRSPSGEGAAAVRQTQKVLRCRTTASVSCQRTAWAG